mmetsp:Transcript_18441/g.42301  ORF Transcript_18441/g.42301 Transcript_18441/m.42301 type:complete len:193 (-) Transcript_18441:442-1020(-)
MSKCTKRQKLVGASSRNASSLGSFEYFECRRYVWWDNRQESRTKSDRNFLERRMALLYLARRNSDELLTQAAVLGKTFAELSSCCRGPYAIVPDRPWDSGFYELSEAELLNYGTNCASAIHKLKPASGTVYSFVGHPVETTDLDELLALLDAPWSASTEPEEERRKAQEVREGANKNRAGPWRRLADGQFAE